MFSQHIPHCIPPLQLFVQIYPFLPLLTLAHTGSDAWQVQSNQAPTMSLNTLWENSSLSSCPESKLLLRNLSRHTRPSVAARKDFPCRRRRTKNKKMRKQSLEQTFVSLLSLSYIASEGDSLNQKKLFFTSLLVILHCCLFTIYSRSHLVLVFSCAIFRDR